jgi:hypothetical protein
MKQKYEAKDLQGLVDLGREQGYLTFEQVNDFLPQDVASPTDLRAALESFEDMDIKVLGKSPPRAPRAKSRPSPRRNPTKRPPTRAIRPTRYGSTSRRWSTFSSSHASRRSK